VVERINSGIDGLDAFLGGGYIRSSSITVSGPTGSGKSTFGMQFLLGGVERGEKGIYISLEEDKRTFLRNASGYRWNTTKLEREQKLYILDYPLGETDQLIEKNSAVEELIFTTGAERIVIDSIRPLAVRFNNEEERMRVFLRLMQNLRRWDVTALVITEDLHPTTFNVIPETKYGIESLTDVWIHLYYLYEKGKRKRVMEILKMKGTHHHRGLIPFEIREDGIVLI